MRKTDLTQKVNELRGLRRMADELNAEIESLQDAIKAEMTAQEVDELIGSDLKITWKLIPTRRFDAKAFQQNNPALYEQYTSESATRRFCLT